MSLHRIFNYENKICERTSELVEKFLKVYEKARVWQDANLDEAIKVYTSVKR